jgi:uncharacterized membrane protein YtjA (UPF0391 family)
MRFFYTGSFTGWASNSTVTGRGSHFPIGEKEWHSCFRVRLNQNKKPMLRWSLIFLVVAIIAGVLGFTHIAEGAANIAQVLFIIFISLFVLALIGGMFLFKKK